MIPAPFEYASPTSVGDAVSALAAAGEDAKVLAGGQSLIPVLRLRLAYPSTVVDLGRRSLVDLGRLSRRGRGVVLFFGGLGHASSLVTTCRRAHVTDPLQRFLFPLARRGTS